MSHGEERSKKKTMDTQEYCINGSFFALHESEGKVAVNAYVTSRRPSVMSKGWFEQIPNQERRLRQLRYLFGRLRRSSELSVEAEHEGTLNYNSLLIPAVTGILSRKDGTAITSNEVKKIIETEGEFLKSCPPDRWF